MGDACGGEEMPIRVWDGNVKKKQLVRCRPKWESKIKIRYVKM